MELEKWKQNVSEKIIETDKMEIIVYYKSYIINEHLKIEEN